MFNRKIRLITITILGLSLLAACSFSGKQTDKDNAIIHETYEKFLSGDMSLLDSSKDSWYVPNFPGEDLNFEYTFLDLDGDEKDELLVQVENDPGTYNSVFHYSEGNITCWSSDSVEAICYSYPLKNGLMVEEYDYGDQISYDIYRYLSSGEIENVKSLYVHEIFIDPEDAGNIPEYKVDDKDVTKEVFEKELKEDVTDNLLKQSAWKRLKHK